MKLQNEELLKSWLIKWTSACISHKWETSQKKAFCNTNIEKVEILHVLHDKIALLMRRRSERGTRNCHQRLLRKVWTIYIENFDQQMSSLHDSDKIKIRLPFYRFLFGGLCTQVFYSSVWGKKWLEVICVVKSKVIQRQPKYEIRNFLKCNSLMKRFLRDIHWNQKHRNPAEFLVFAFSNSWITLA